MFGLATFPKTVTKRPNFFGTSQSKTNRFDLQAEMNLMFSELLLTNCFLYSRIWKYFYGRFLPVSRLISFDISLRAAKI